MSRTVTSLDDRYTATSGEVHLTGTQALVRTMLDQRRLDDQRQLNTGLFLSGYQGSPLGGIDREVIRLQSMMESAGVVFRPGLNEELGATAVAGTQLVQSLEHSRVDGVTGIWFGKNPGFDRAADALRHANITGTAPLGGAVAWIGDDPSSKSSTVPSSCEPMCRSLLMPLLAPGTVGEILHFGLHAVAMSRYSGLWTGLKIVADIADASAIVSVDGLFDDIPEMVRPGAFTPPLLLPPSNLDAEFDQMTARLARAVEYAERANLNRITYNPPKATIAIVAAGAAYQGVRRALMDLGMVDADLDRLGIRLIQLGMPWPLDPGTTRRLLEGVETVVVVEDKLSFVEGLIRDNLYGTDHQPLVIGKFDADGEVLLTPRSELLADDIIGALVRVVPGLGDFPIPTPRRRTRHLDLLPPRSPAFCSGCPHSRSTRAETDQLVGVGIGCHVMVALEKVPSGPKRGQLVGITQMGGEGSQWIGIEPFTDDKHFFQNVGDGTFYHSASLAIRAAVAAKSTITYKLLVNDAVAMTGGQHPSGQMPLPTLTRWLKSEGVGRIVITTADPKPLRRLGVRRRFGPGVEVHHRDDLAELQRELENEPGVSVLMHVDRCATEERRMRKRGKAKAPAERVWINERVCEGCGDCGDKSTCLSVQPVKTEFGRKTRIHQSSCNQDFSCLKGDCPSFVMVKPGSRPKTARVPDVELPEPRRKVGDDVLIRMPGVGGTGVVTLSAMLQMAAFLDGTFSAGLEQIGLAQKGGPVISDLRFSKEPITAQLRASRGRVDVLIGLDPLGAADDKHLDSLRPGAIAVVNTGENPTATMVQDTSVHLPSLSSLRSRIDAATGAPEDNVYLDADLLADQWFANHMPANLIMIGAAYQAGLLPVTAEGIEQAIRLNGASIENNLEAFRLGRIVVAKPEVLDPEFDAEPQTDPVARMERLVGEVSAWQNPRLGERFRSDIDQIRGALGDRSDLSAEQREDLRAVYAESFFKLTTYKDEYEVARLHLDSAERARRDRQFGKDAKVRIMLHPPVLRALGLKHKIGFGSWVIPVLRLLAAMKFLRASRLNPCGIGEVRRIERALAGEFADAVHRAITDGMSASDLAELVGAPDMVRGYEHVKLRNVERYRARVAELLANTPRPAAHTSTQSRAEGALSAGNPS